MTAEKISPSPLTIVAELGNAIDLERKMSAKKHMPLKDVLGRVCSQFNHMVTARKHKIDSGVKAMAYNLTLGCACEMGRFCNKFLFDIVLPNLYRIQLNLF